MSHREQDCSESTLWRIKKFCCLVSLCSLNSVLCGIARGAIRMRICFITLLTCLSLMSYRVLFMNYSNFGNDKVSSKSPCILS